MITNNISSDQNQDEFLFLGTVGGEMATYNLDTGSVCILFAARSKVIDSLLIYS